MANTYCALYRKYRPENLDDVVGQNVIVKTLKHAVKNNYLSHAYLFTGPRGTGKTSIAKILAKTINCTNLQTTSPCNNCVSCTQINNKQNIDIIEIDAASNNGVDEIREIRNKVTLVPSISKYKVYIIDEVHMLTTGAFNALLKTLEEPPSHIIFILATTEPHKIPNTILSRCQRFDFKRISVDDIFNRLKYICTKENISIEDEALYEIALSSDGGMRDAIGTLDQVISYAENNITISDVHEINGTLSDEEISKFVDLLISKKLDLLLISIDYYYNDGKNIVKILEKMVIFLKNILIFKIAPNYFKNNQYDYQFFVKYDDVECEELIGYITNFNTEINEIKKSNLPKFLFELLIIKSINSNNKNLEIDKIVNVQSKSIAESQIKSKSLEKNVEVQINKENDENVVVTNLPNKCVELQHIRISNTLSRFSKKITIKLRQEIEGLNTLLLNPEISQIVSIILDGKLKAASDKYIIFVLETCNSANLFNANLVSIENVLADFFNQKYRVIGIQESEWNKIKKEFNSKSKVFNYVDEKENYLIANNKENSPENDIEKIFGEIVEYEER